MFRNKKIEHLVSVEVSTTMCHKCYCLIYDHMARLLQHDDISKMYYREKNVNRILPEVADEMERLANKSIQIVYMTHHLSIQISRILLFC